MNMQTQPPYSPLLISGHEYSPNSPTTPPPPPPTKRKAGRKRFRETRHPIYRGVRQRDGGKWVCEVREPQKKTRIWVGTYPSAELAARAHDVAALVLKGNRAALNFADSARLSPRAKSTSAGDIRFAALQATTRLCDQSREGSVEGSRRDDMECVKKGLEDSRELFLDEEAIFNMPVLIDSMAEGMLLTPPALKRGTNWGEFDEDDANSLIAFDLW